MKKSIRKVALAAVAFAIGLGLPSAAQAGDPPGGVPLAQHACQRDCLETYMKKYLEAMASHTVSDDLFARDVRFTENGVELPLGNEGLWATASGVGNYKFFVPDVETQQVAFLGTMMEVASSSATGRSSTSRRLRRL